MGNSLDAWMRRADQSLQAGYLRFDVSHSTASASLRGRYALRRLLLKPDPSLDRVRRTLRLPIDPLASSQSVADAPFIDVAICAAPKDFPQLALVVESAYLASLNPVASICIATPGAAVKQVQDLLDEASISKICPVPISVLDENDLIAAQTRRALRAFNPARYGWALQQALKLELARRSTVGQTLVVDCDTFLMSARLWVDSYGVQVLTPTLEYHFPYYEVLRELRVISDLPKQSFVPHHMLFQADVVEAILDEWFDKSIDNLVERALSVADRDTESFFCIEYELYAQGLIRLMPERVAFAKWSNRAVSARHWPTPTSRSWLMNQSFSKGFCSVSAHHYLAGR